MKILFVDDSPARHDFICTRKHKQHGQVHTCTRDNFIIVHAYNVFQARSLLLESVQRSRQVNSPYLFQLICLDHDMDPNHDENNNGVALAQSLAGIEVYIRADPKIIVHSWNHAGATRMVDILKHAGYTQVLFNPFAVA